jgi:hypothetical protein
MALYRRLFRFTDRTHASKVLFDHFRPVLFFTFVFCALHTA